MSTSTQAKAKLAQINKAANEEASTDEVRAELATLKEDFATLLSTVSDLAKSKSNDGVEKSKEMADLAEKKLTESKDQVENKIRENPLTAIGIALGAGVLLASLRK